MISYLLVFVAFNAFGQTSSSPVAHSIIYDQTVERYYTIEAGTSVDILSPLDRVLTHKKTEITHTEIANDVAGDQVATTTYLNAADFFNEWPVFPTTFINDKNGHRVYDATGNVLVNIPLDSSEVVEYNDLKSMRSNNSLQFVSAFPVAPTGSQISDLQNLGMNVQVFNNGTYQIGQGSVATLFDPANLKKIHTRKEGAKVVSTRTEVLQMAPNGNYLVPAAEYTMESEQRPSGACMQSVTVKAYQNYRIEQPAPAPRSFETANLADEVRIFPNPAESFVKIQYTAEPGNLIEITARNIQGRLMFTQKISGEFGTETIDMSGWPDGMYLVQAKSNQFAKTTKIIKTSH